MRPSPRRVLAMLAVAAMSLVAPVRQTAATGTFDLTGVHLFASSAVDGAGSMAVTWSCDEDGTSTFSFTASGVASGPYPGTFIATGSGEIGPQGVPPGQGVQSGAIATFDSTFAIDSPAGMITGTTALPIPDPDGGYCVDPLQPSPFSAVNFYLPEASYDAGLGSDTDAGGTVVSSTYMCSSGCGDAFRQTFVSSAPTGTVPGAPRAVAAAAGDGTIVVSWLPPDSDGGRSITQYVLAITMNGETVELGSVGPMTSATFTGTDNDLEVAFIVAAENVYGRGPFSSQSSSVVTRAGAPEPQVSSVVIDASGGSATTDSGGTGPTLSNPVTTAVSVPATAEGGILSIAESAPGPAPSGFVFLGQEITIHSTAATDVANPLTIVFDVDPSFVPVTIFRNGVPVDQPCNPAGTATPTPCIAAGAGTSHITILAAQASVWNVGLGAYDFSGFSAPVDNLPTLNTAKAGSSIPIRFGLGGDRGPNVLATGSPRSQRVSCDAGALVDAIEETASASASGLVYSAGTDRYQYTWKTERSWAGTCRKFTLGLRDGSAHEALFSFQ